MRKHGQQSSQPRQCSSWDVVDVDVFLGVPIFSIQSSSCITQRSSCVQQYRSGLWNYGRPVPVHLHLGLCHRTLAVVVGPPSAVVTNASYVLDHQQRFYNQSCMHEFRYFSVQEFSAGLGMIPTDLPLCRPRVLLPSRCCNRV